MDWDEILAFNSRRCRWAGQVNEWISSECRIGAHTSGEIIRDFQVTVLGRHGQVEGRDGHALGLAQGARIVGRHGVLTSDGLEGRRRRSGSSRGRLEHRRNGHSWALVRHGQSRVEEPAWRRGEEDRPGGGSILPMAILACDRLKNWKSWSTAPIRTVRAMIISEGAGVKERKGTEERKAERQIKTVATIIEINSNNQIQEGVERNRRRGASERARERVCVRDASDSGETGRTHTREQC